MAAVWTNSCLRASFSGLAERDRSPSAASNDLADSQLCLRGSYGGSSFTGACATSSSLSFPSISMSSTALNSVRGSDFGGSWDNSCLKSAGVKFDGASKRLCHTKNKRARRQSGIRAAAETPYDILGVQKGATDKQIKAAYRKLALKYHPDVNKAPDAQAQFLRIKGAYQTLSDPQSRAKQDRAATGGGFRAADFDPFSWGGGGGARKKQEQEEFYGFEDFFRDLSSDLEKRKAASGGKPKSLWEELQDIGEEFVEFLEKNLPAEASPDRVKSEYEDFAAWSEKDNSKGQRNEATAKASSTAGSARSSNGSTPRKEEPPKNPEKDIDDMLANLKKELGL